MPVLGLRPEIGIAPQFPQGARRGNRLQRPVKRHRREIGDMRPEPRALGSGGGAGRSADIAEADEGEGRPAQRVARLGGNEKQAYEDGGRVKKGRDHRRAERGQKGERSCRARGRGQLLRVPRMHGESLGVALDPARTLVKPGGRPFRCLLARRRGDEPGAVSAGGEAEAEIGILGDVARVPEAHGFQRIAAEEIARSAERHGTAEARQQREKGIEVTGIFERELTCQPVGAAIVPAERCLQAGEAVLRILEHLDGSSDLARVGDVLGVIDAHDGSGRESHRVVEGARLGLGMARRYDNDLETGIEFEPACGGERIRIDGFGNQLDVELVRGIVAELCSKRTKVG